MLKKKSAIMMVVAVTVGSLFAPGVAGGCWNVGTGAFMTSLNPCGIFNCSGTLFGGAISLCGVPGDPTDDVVAGCP